MTDTWKQMTPEQREARAKKMAATFARKRRAKKRADPPPADVVAYEIPIAGAARPVNGAGVDALAELIVAVWRKLGG